ncbi:hypothetical protein IMZ48_34930 [Candidatus Bathyarchaeota archaeon]|nr:hypothetical protein [Candidatus Bathyarchaeota archaeon]
MKPVQAFQAEPISAPNSSGMSSLTSSHWNASSIRILQTILPFQFSRRFSVL